MADEVTGSRYPTYEEFWKRLELREVEADLRDELRSRTLREKRHISRAGAEATVIAVAERILPGDVPARALAVFLDESFDKQAGRADEKTGVMPRSELIPTGFRLIDEESQKQFGAKFAEVSAARQDELLSAAEERKIKGPERFDSGVWFRKVRESIITAFGSDPRGMVQMGFPGPSFKPGHLWLDRPTTEARAARRSGYMKL
jgi:hypothetical protein